MQVWAGNNMLLEPAFLSDVTNWWNIKHVAAITSRSPSGRRRLQWAGLADLNQTEVAGPGGPEQCERDQNCWKTVGGGRGNFSLLARDCYEVRVTVLARAVNQSNCKNKRL
jgi:hypothetical protein